MEDFTFDSDEIIIFCSNFDTILREELTDSILEVNLQDLNERWSHLQKSYRNLCLNKNQLKADELDTVRNKYISCTQSFHTCKSKIYDLQKSLVSSPGANAIDNPIQLVNYEENNFSSIKVPPCDTEIFYGGYEEWPSFRDMFTAVYVNHPKLSSVQKLYHLRLKVRGQAGGIVKKYTLCGENFALAWEALRSRYENRRILVDNQIKTLLNIKHIPSESSESLQDIQTTINDCLSALKAQNITTTNWDPIIVYLCSTKLPHETLSLWEQSLKSHRDLPKWEEMDAFLSNRYEVVERLNSIHGIKTISRKKGDPDVNTFNIESTPQFPCKLCKLHHALKHCSEYKKLSIKGRHEFVSKNKICFNCLSYTHLFKDCKSKNVCMECQKKHHTSLHTISNTNKVQCSGNNDRHTQQPHESPSTSGKNSLTSRTASHFIMNQNQTTDNTLLPTALVHISHSGDTFRARAFLDQGSEKTFISKKLQQTLMLPCEPRNFQIRGIGGSVVANSNSLCNLTLFSEKHNKYIPIQAIVVPKITRLLPNFSVSASNFSLDEIKGLNLADPFFYSPGHVDLLIGSNVIPNLLLDGVKKVCQSLVAQATIFGWVISGPVATQTISSFSIEATENSDDIISKQLRAFWEQEEIPSRRPRSEADELCESLFNKTTVRDSNGRYVVKLPFKTSFPKEMPLGPSRTQALIQYIRMEQSLKNNPELAEAYHNVLNEYIALDHMEASTSQELSSRGSYNSFYLPHHAVVKPESHTTKLRVVFNASKRTYSGYSLNDVLYVGPTLQADLTNLILSWRLYQFVFSGDIEKMYRQIRIHEDDIPFQRIVFRPTPTSPISDYGLKTVTFGLNCAPYLAIRTLLQLARDNEEKFPQASKILQKETYVDDILSGGHDQDSAKESLSQLITLLQSGGFPLRKITSNSPEILSSVSPENMLDSDFLKFHDTSTTKTLGIQWNALSDCFSYKVEPIQTSNNITKRQILSTISKLFDPAGWLCPIIIKAKILLQQLWLEGIQWDEHVNQPTLQKWHSFIQSLDYIQNIRIPRWLNFAPQSKTQIHGFCDASEKAFCAVIYLRIQSGNRIHSNLLIAKSKVAPLNPISLPRLELCGAVLLSKLICQVLKDLPIQNYELHLWCDSSIVLGWLQKPPCTWKTYVANRTAEIIRNVGNCSWRHIRSFENPADLGSRGLSAQDLFNNNLWWHGPNWLQQSSEEWPDSMQITSNPPEIKKIEVFCAFEEYPDILQRFSRWDKAIRVIAYVLRFLSRISKKSVQFSSLSITHLEFRAAKNRLICLTQQRYFYKEYISLRTSKTVSKKSSLFPLNPFVDDNNIIRVNGRITNSDLSYNERYPIIIPVKSKFCELFVSFVHNLLMHAEHNLMLRTIRNEYYISRLRSSIKKCILSCKTCLIYKQKLQSQMMAALPFDRSHFTPPFTITGVDFAGPFPIKTSILRQATYHKGYVCLFVCFCTKAIHLELCSDLSSSSFLAAFTRFVGRRGLPKRIMSDNGTNFVGAGRILKKDFETFINTTSKETAKKYISHGFEWSFIPPNAPHMGGIWEAGVRSFKMHFCKVTQNHKFTFEEFSTLLTRIEAILNSRPLSPMTDDPNELLALTPGHLLRGAPLVNFPDSPPNSITSHDRWDKLKVMQHQFARRWKDEYLKELQRRYKWQQPQDDLKVGQLVVVKDDQAPPCEWRLGRIKQTFQGQDDFVRVAEVKTQDGTFIRPIVKLCALPIGLESSSG